MWEKFNNLRKIYESGMIVIIRTSDPAEALKVAEASIAGGVQALEITMSVPGALRVIETLAQKYCHGEVLIGAGTVLDAETARSVILAGAQLIVTPHMNKQVIKMCNRYQVVSVIGAMTPKEIVKTMEAGADIVKLFPGEFTKSQYVKTVKAPLSQAPIIPTGGVTPQNVGEWIDAGCIAVGVGSYITKAAQKDGDYSKVTTAAKEFVAAIAAARKK
jgi:2-dehydro-3-deoxyphosphogluconate aldolase/(4S)-4-hydroxy-2-oxoglutarate aldolase